MLSRRGMLAGTAAAGVAAPAIARAADRRAQAVAAIETWAADKKIPGLAVTLMEDGKPTVVRGLGVRSLETKDPLTPSTLVRVGSVSKAFTALTFLKLVDEKKLELDKPLIGYAPEFRVDGRITGRMALSHSGGMTDVVGDRPSRGDDAIRDYVAAMTTAWRQFEPGAVFSYSNPGYAPVTLAIEREGGRPFVVQADRMLAALGLSATFDLGRVLVRPHSVAHMDVGQGMAPMNRDPGPEFPHDLGAGMLWMSAEDAGKWMAWMMTGPGAGGAVSQAAFEQLVKPVQGVPALDAKYALGLNIEQRGSERIVAHGGGIWGHSAYWETAPARGCGVALFANSVGTGGRGALVEQVMELLGGVPKSPGAAPTPSKPEHAGRFEHRSPQGTRTVEIIREGEALIRKRPGRDPLALPGFRSDVFGPPEGPRYAYVRNVSGEVVGLSSGSRHFAKV